MTLRSCFRCYLKYRNLNIEPKTPPPRPFPPFLSSPFIFFEYRTENTPPAPPFAIPCQARLFSSDAEDRIKQSNVEHPTSNFDYEYLIEPISSFRISYKQYFHPIILTWEVPYKLAFQFAMHPSSPIASGGDFSSLWCTGISIRVPCYACTAYFWWEKRLIFCSACGKPTCRIYQLHEIDVRCASFPLQTPALNFELNPVFEVQMFW